MKSLVTLFLLALLLGCGLPLRAQTPPTGFTSTTVSAGWNEAVGLTFTSTGSKMFVWERPGKVWVVVNGQRQLVLDISPEVGAWEDQGLLGFALDPNFTTNGYMYLLYVVDRHYLLNFGTPAYSASTDDYYSATIGRLTRYTATASGTGYTVDPASRLVLMGATKTTGIPSTFNGHVTAGLAFGTDGTLLVATGDGAHPYPDLGNYDFTYTAQAVADGIISTKENVGSLRAQLVDCLSGKILRINPATGAGVASNPFFDATNPNAPRSKVWALGFRNPFRMTIKPGTGSTDPTAANPGVLYIGDVGAASWEELHVVAGPRVNCGWPLFEGLTPYAAFTTSNVYNRDAPNPLYNVGGCTKQFFYFQDLIAQATPGGTATFPNSCNTAQTIPATVPTFVHARPLIDWGHGAGPSRTGTFSGSTATAVNLGAAGAPVSGSQFGGSASTGGVFYPYNDFPAAYRNTYFFGDYVGGWIRNLTVNASNQPSAVGDFVGSGAVPVAFAVSPAETGLFYVNFYPSEIRKISYVTASSPPVAVASSNKTYGPSPLAVQFTGSASVDPGGSALTYLWNFGDGTTSTAQNPAHTFTAPNSAPKNFPVTLTVTNALGLSNQATLSISANNTPPQVTITSPAAGTLYPLTANTTYQLRATVTDAEHSGHLLSYQWQTFLHHASHEHPDPVDTTRQTSTTIVPYGCGAETYYYRIVLTVTDAGGLATTQEVRLNPDCNSTSFTLVDADADEDIQALVNGAILNLATLPTRNLNIRANANPSTTGSVVFALTGPQAQNQTESIAPYALFSDSGGDYNPWTPPVGNYALVATPYSGASGTGTPGAALAISFSVTDTGTPGPFSLTTAVFGSGTVAKSPDLATYPNNTTVTLTATPAGGFQFTGWSGSATGTANPLAVPMTSNKNITATFTAIPPTSYTLTTTVVGSGTVARSAAGPAYPSGASMTLTATPAAGFAFTGWSGAATSTTNPLSVTMDADKSITATFAAVSGGSFAFYRAINLAGPALTLDGNAWAGSTAPNYATNGTAFQNQAVTLIPATDAVRAGMIRAAVYEPNLSVTLSAVPAGTYQAYLYVWEDSSPEVYSLALNGQAVLTNYNSGPGGTWARLGPYPVTLAAAGSVQFTSSGGWPNFSGVELWQQTGTPPTSFTLTTAVVGSGTIARSTAGPSYPSGTTVTLTATPAAGFQFSGWSGAATGTTTPLAVVMTANKTITATFTAIPPATFTLTTATVSSGSITRSAAGPSYASGTVVSLTAVPAAGFSFTGWSGDATGTTNPLAVTMTANKAITATFAATVPQYSLAVNVTGSGTVARSPNQTTYASGTTVTLTAAPAAGYQFTGWSGAATGTTNPLTVTMTGNKTITATFAVTTTTYTLTVSTSGSGTVSKSPNQTTYLSGITVTLTATPAAGYQFTGWSGGATGTTNPLAVVMTANKTITATFTAIPQYTLTVTTSGSGTVAKSPNQTTYASGTTVTLTATPAAGYQFSAWSGAATGSTNPLAVAMTANKAITATFTALPAGQRVAALILVNADTDLDLQTLATGTTLNLAALPTPNLAIRASTVPATVGSVVFNLSGAQSTVHNETTPPYALFSDWSGDYNPWTPSLGSYTLVATPYTGTDGSGTAGTALSINFTVTNQAARGAKPTATTSAAKPELMPAAAYPNPSGDGRFWVRVPATFQGAVRYRLVTAIGGTVATGIFPVEGDAPVQLLDFSRETGATGLYYLLLENNQEAAQLKLMRK